jgi:hypothetical protein
LRKRLSLSITVTGGERMKSKKEPTKPEASTTTSLPQWLLEESDTLKEMIEWWKSRESAAMEASVRRPVFIGKTRNTGIRVSEAILDRAVAKAKQEKLKTGGNLSQLVEWLMWIYLGSPDDVVERLHPPE